MDALDTLVFISLFVAGTYASLLEGMILYPVRLFLSKAPKWAHKPLFDCVWCMASTWGSIAFAALQITDMTAVDWWTLPIFLPAIAATSAIFDRITE